MKIMYENLNRTNSKIYILISSKVIREKLQPPWKYHAPATASYLPPKILIFPTPPLFSNFPKSLKPPPSSIPPKFRGEVDTMVSVWLQRFYANNTLNSFNNLT